MTSSLYDDDVMVGKLTRYAFQQTSSRLLQIHRFAETDEAHVEELLDIFNPASGECIADVGCGVGRLAEMMQEIRPDLDFILVNKSETQLAMCPAGFTKKFGLAEDLPFSPGDVDSIMATYVLGHVDLPRFINECRRLLAPRVYVYDLFRRSKARDCQIEKDLEYTERTIGDMLETFEYGGLKCLRLQCADLVPDDISRLMPNPDTLSNAVSAALVFEKKR